MLVIFSVQLDAVFLYNNDELYNVYFKLSGAIFILALVYQNNSPHKYLIIFFFISSTLILFHAMANDFVPTRVIEFVFKI